MNQTQKLRQACSGLGLQLSGTQQDQLLGLMEQIAKWGKVFNLTSVVSPDQMLSVHLFDCLALVAQLRTRFAATFLANPLQMLDVGSGAGLPGLILAICSDPAYLSVRVTSVDTVEKKIAFQRQQQLLFQLDNFQPIHARVEVLNLLDIEGSPTSFAGFDLITCRAFASLSDFCNSSAHLLSNQSPISERFVAMKAKLADTELDALPNTVQLIELQPLQVPGLAEAQRCLVWLGLSSENNNKKEP